MSAPVPPIRLAGLVQEVESLCAEPGVDAVALLLIQLAGLSEINEKHGYCAGDRVLEECGARLAEVGREQDRLVPLYGHGHALLVRNPLHEGHAVLAAEKIARVIAEPVEIDGQRVRIRSRVGIALLPGTTHDAAELLRQAEAAVAEARAADEPHVVFHAALGSAAAGSTAAWFDIEDALQRGEFTLHYQPQVRLSTGGLCGAEALVRWQHPERGVLPPAYFLDAIEGGQNVRPLLWFVLNAAMRQAREWLVARPDFTIAVNVSPGNLTDPDLVELVDEAMRIWSFPPPQLILEITETALMRDTGAAIDRLHELRSRGCQVAVDDFGTGYSSLAYLKNLPVDELKIDKSFIQPMARYEVDRRIVRSIVQLGHAVSLKVVAEGIDAEPVRESLAAMDCDIGQGYLFGRPQAAEDFEGSWIMPGSSVGATPASAQQV